MSAKTSSNSARQPRLSATGSSSVTLRATGCETGVLAHPVRARRRKGQEMGNVEGERVDHWDRLFGGTHTDVHVHPEDLEPAGQPLHVVDKPCVARVGADVLLGPVAE